MAVARIITSTPQDAGDASEYLRSLGYAVEMVLPGDFRVAPADLEINLSQCRREQAVARAKAAVEAHANHHVPAQNEPRPLPAPSLETRKVAVAYDIAGRPVEFAEEMPVPERAKAADKIGNVKVVLHGLIRGSASVCGAMCGAYGAGQKWVADFRRQRVAERALRLEAELARKGVAILRRLNERGHKPIVSARPERSQRGSRLAQLCFAWRDQVRDVISGSPVAVGSAVLLALLLGFVAGRQSASPTPGGTLPDALIKIKPNPAFGSTITTPPRPARAKVASAPRAALSSGVATPRKVSTPLQSRPAKSKPTRQYRQNSQDRADENLADDEVVVRHFPTPRSKPSTTPATKVKYYSDMN